MLYLTLVCVHATVCVCVCVCVCVRADMRRHCAKAVVSSEPLLPVARRKRARVEEEEGREEEGEAEGGDGCVQTSKRQDREL